jgi:hypothetical protein
VRTLLMSGRDVICDDMNLQNKQVKAWMKLAKEVGAGFEVVDFTNVSVEECIHRDSERRVSGGRGVGAEYIAAKHRQFIKGRPYPLPLPELSAGQYVEPYTPPPGGQKAILVDIDGTMALMNGRSPFDWHRVGEDKPNLPIVNLVWAYARSPWAAGTQVIFMSGRDRVCEDDTAEWLAGLGFEGATLFMRPEGDLRLITW